MRFYMCPHQHWGMSLAARCVTFCDILSISVSLKGYVYSLDKPEKSLIQEGLKFQKVIA